MVPEGETTQPTGPRSVRVAPLRRRPAVTGGAIAGAILYVLAAGAANAQSSPLGTWATDDGWTIRVANCATGLCATIIGLSPRPNAPQTDRKNPNPALQNRPLCGMTVLWNYTQSRSRPGRWEGGWIYNAEEGKTYRSQKWVEGGLLRVRGYVGTPLLGRTITLRRVARPVNPC